MKYTFCCVKAKQFFLWVHRGIVHVNIVSSIHIVDQSEEKQTNKSQTWYNKKGAPAIMLQLNLESSSGDGLSLCPEEGSEKC